ncbi:multi anti extrusion family protein, partial [Xanthomonas arboricola pv. pruni str. MAFF 311562]
MPKSAVLTEGPIGKNLLLFAMPILAGNIAQSLNGSINAIWVGRYLGEAALTAAANANSIMFFLIGSVFGIGMASTILIGQAMGARDIAQARKVMGTSASFFGGLSALIAVLGWFLAPALVDRNEHATRIADIGRGVPAGDLP